MLDINMIRSKYDAKDALALKKQFQELLSKQWNNMNKYLKNQEIDESIKYRILYLYDEIRNSIDDKFGNINKSFFVLYNERLSKVNELHSDEHQKCLDILNLFSNIEYYLDSVDDVDLKNYYHLDNGVKLFSQTGGLMKKGDLIEEDILC